jgi:L-2-hydroxyglutarate oxidase
MEQADLAIVGGGIVGLATAYRYQQRFPGRRVVVLEKEPEVGRHQTGHNSGVLHSGIYYRPGSLKATNCRLGKQAMQEFCAEHQVPFDICGKVIVATSEAELPRLETIFHRGQQNGVRCEMIDARRLSELEPHAAGLQAIYVPETGIVDFQQVCGKLAEVIERAGGAVWLKSPLCSFHLENGIAALSTPRAVLHARQVVNCTGLQSDRVARTLGHPPTSPIVPFRGEYYLLKPSAYHLCRNLIYPVPDPAFPFLGVHFTRMIDGSVECGPNAVLALAREGYHKFAFNVRDVWQSLSYPGFWRLAGRHWRMGLGEIWRSFSRAAFVRALQRLVPGILAEHLMPAEPGIRAQVLHPDGLLEDDFLIRTSPQVTHVLNAPSPAATASLQIAQTVVAQLPDA